MRRFTIAARLRSILRRKDEEEETSASEVRQYIAEEAVSSGWVKCLPAEPEDVDNQEVYMVLCLETEPTDEGLKVTDIIVKARMVENPSFGGMMIDAGTNIIDSHFFEMELVPPEILYEIAHLYDGFYIPDGFSFIGKPLPEDLEDFHANPEYSCANNSGLKNIYWHLSFEAKKDEGHKTFENFDLSAYGREESMFQGPQPKATEKIDALESLLYICDRYTPEEWKSIMGR